MSVWSSWHAEWNAWDDPWFDVAIPVVMINGELLRICINDEDVYLTVDEVKELESAVAAALRRFSYES